MENETKIENENFRMRLMKAAEAVVGADKGKIGSAFNPEILECNFKERTAVFRYEFQPWMLNCNDVMHGGMICTTLDSSMGWISCGYPEELNITPSVSMHVTYMEPIFKSDYVCVKAHLTASKGKLFFAEAEMFFEDAPDVILASAVGEYYRMGSAVKLHTENDHQ